MAKLRRLLLVFALPLAVTVAACASLGSPSISEVQANPGRYSDHTVTVTGTVTTAWGIPLVPYKMYRVTDGTSEILVLSDNTRTPSRGAKVVSAARWRNSPCSAADRSASTCGRRALRCCR
jgi:hypothetical protein